MPIAVICRRRFLLLSAARAHALRKQTCRVVRVRCRDSRRRYGVQVMRRRRIGEARGHARGRGVFGQDARAGLVLAVRFCTALLGRYGVALVVVGVAAARLLRQADVIEIRCAAVVFVDKVDLYHFHSLILLRNNDAACKLPVRVVLAERDEMPFLSAHAGVIHCREYAEVGLFTFVHSRRAAYRRRFAPARYDVCAKMEIISIITHTLVALWTAHQKDHTSTRLSYPIRELFQIHSYGKHI